MQNKPNIASIHYETVLKDGFFIDQKEAFKFTRHQMKWFFYEYFSTFTLKQGAIMRALQMSENSYMKIRLYLFRLLNGSKFGQYKGHIHRPLKIQGHAYIHIEAGVFVHDLTWLGAYKIGNKDPELRLKEGVCIGHFNHFSCAEKIILEKNVLTADKVFITDNTHAFEDISKPINFQPINVIRPVIIGEGAWIGENVSILGCSVGKNSVIGANSVVTKDVPDYCVAVGNPARVIKRYDLEKQEWVSC